MHGKRLVQNWIDGVTACGSRDMLEATALLGLSQEDWEYHLSSLPEEDRADVDREEVDGMVVAYCRRRLADLGIDAALRRTGRRK